MQRLQRLHQRNQHALIGDEHAVQQQEEEDVGARKAPLRQHVAVDGAQHARENRCRNHHLEAIGHVILERVVGRPERIGVETGRQVPHLFEVDLFEALEPGHQQHVDGHQVDQREEHEHGVNAYA